MNPAEQLILLGGTSSATGSSSGPTNGALDFTAAGQSALFVVLFF